MNELDQRFREAAREYPSLRHFAVLHDYREFDATEAVRVAPIMGMYHDLLVRPICDGRMVGTCHLPGRASLLSRFVLTALHGMEDVGAVTGSISVLCDGRDASRTSDDQRGRPRAFELLDELARSWVRAVVPEIVEAGGPRYDWPGHVLHLLHLVATTLEDGYLHSGCHKLVWDRGSVGVKRKDDRTVQMYELAPGYVGVVPDGEAVAADGTMLDWEFVLSVLSCLHVRVRVLEPSVFDALGYWTRLLLDAKDLRLDSLLYKTLIAADDTGAVGMPDAETEDEGAEKLSVGGWQWVESMLCETWKRGVPATRDADPPEEPDKNNADDSDEPLAPNERDILQAMYLADACSSDERLSQEEIVLEAFGSQADYNWYKDVFSGLKKAGFLDSRKGRGGGMWLTEKGETRAARLSRKK